jgi:hypothetical protein
MFLLLKIAQHFFIRIVLLAHNEASLDPQTVFFNRFYAIVQMLAVYNVENCPRLKGCTPMCPI